MLVSRDCARRLPSALLACAFLMSHAVIDLRAQAGGTAQQVTSVKVLAYEVVSIKPTAPDDHESGWKTLPDGFDFKNGALFWLIDQAYGIVMDSQVSGLPAWVKNDHYNVSARVDEDTAEAWKKLSRQDLAKQQQLMLQAVFADRCQLKMRREVKELPVYDLVIAPGGLKMKEAAPDEKELSYWKQTTWYGAAGPGGEYTITVNTHAGTVQALAQELPRSVGRIIVDKTGLGERKFDFDLKWSSSDQAPRDGGDTGPMIFTALEEQLGLKLVPAKEPVETFVVEQMERPSAN